MNIRDLHYLVAVAELRNFSQAADRCFVSQPTLSSQIKKVEEQLGVVIFERSNKKVMLTEVGQTIIASARRILREVDVMKETAESASDPLSGRFRLGAFPTLAPYYFPKIVPKIKQALPNLTLILQEEKTARLIELLKQAELDAALLALPVEEETLVSEVLLEDEFLLAVAPEHALAGEAHVAEADLAKHALLLLEEGHCLRDQALDVCHRMGAFDEQEFRATSLETLRQMVKAGTGITLMPRIATQNQEGDIVYIPFGAPAPKRTIALVYRKTTPKQQVIDVLRPLLAT